MARERKIEESIWLWEREIVPDWTVVQRNSQLRRLWWQGIPTKLRATMWQNAIGNPLALSKGALEPVTFADDHMLITSQIPSKRVCRERKEH